MLRKIQNILSFEFNMPSLLLAAAFIATGLFYEYISCLASVFMCIYLFVLVHKNKRFIFKVNLTGIAVIVITLFYLMTTLWAIDPGMAFIGFIKILPLPLFMLIIMQQKNSADSFADVLPTISVFMTVVSAIVMAFSPENEFFSPAGRISGFLQYSNTFALILLVSVILIASKDKLKRTDMIYLPVLVAGIILSGSRTVFILTIVSVIAIVIAGKNKRAKLFLLAVTLALIVVAVLYALITDNISTIGRFLTTSFQESTFVGRLLYYQDALALTVQHPFGTGYLGFYYLQQSIQTGLYSVRYIHNDFLQIILDIGWLPAILIIAAIVRCFFSKGVPFSKRLILLVMSAHSFFDVDLQFIAVFMLFILFLDVDKGKEYSFGKSLVGLKSSCVLLAIVSLYMFIPLASANFGKLSLSHTLYPWNTDVNIAMMTNTEDPEEMNDIADMVISQNKYVTVSYSAKAAYAYSKGNFVDMIKYKELALKNAPLMAEEYEDYIKMLLVGEELYIKAGNTESAEFCVNQIKSVLSRFNTIENKLSELGKKINDQPRTKLSEELSVYLEKRGITVS